MKRFWDIAVGPILDVLQPRVIVEIGSSKGANTENLLQYCRSYDALLHVIDPAPLYGAEEWQKENSDHLSFHRGLSLDVLLEIEEFDAVLIDGDHNWYTVFNELKQIERKSLENSQDFPLVMLHDIGWPYGRRDLYYDPATIPEEHRKPHEKKGLRQGVSGLVEEGGLNQHLHNAVEENEPEEGVLTAIEDFLKETRYEIELLKLPGIHGLGVLTTKKLKEENPPLAELLDNLDLQPSAQSYVEGLERARMEQEIHYQTERREHRQRLVNESRKVREERQRTREAHDKLRAANDKLRAANDKLRAANQELARLKQWVELLEKYGPVLLRLRYSKTGITLAKMYRKVRFRDENPNTEAELKNTSE